jgi:hypothetical protein
LGSKESVVGQDRREEEIDEHSKEKEDGKVV